MQKKLIFIIALSNTLLFAGCTLDRSQVEGDLPKDNKGSLTENLNPDKKNNPNDGTTTDVEAPSESELREFFLPAGSVAHFEGVGIEFAQYKVEYAQPFQNYFILHENNGGALLRKVYRVNDDKIEILESTVVNQEESVPMLADLEKLNPIGVYLMKPFEVGTEFGTWKIVETDATVETPYQTFNDAIVIEEVLDNAVNRKYFVSGIGEVMRESIMDTDDGEYVVTSKLRTIDRAK
jgi:hypothetical protein